MEKSPICRLLNTGIKIQEKQYVSGICSSLLLLNLQTFNNRRELRDYLALETRDASDIKTRRRLISAEITPWRNRHLAVFPQLKPFTDALDPEVQPEDEVLLLPSDIPFDQHAALSLTHHASTEFQLREAKQITP